MKLLVLIFIIIASNAIDAEYKSVKVTRNEHVVGSNIHTGTFITKVDHFRPQDPRTVEMQYHSNLNNYQQNGPIYIYIKHMTDNSTRWIEEGLMVDIARNNAAGLFTFDQRYFGNNLMFDEFSWENMSYLTIEQILADIATFIDHVRSSLNSPLAPVILWGSQFGATLSAFTRLKYPHLVNGVWSSSGIYEIHYYTSAYYNLIAYALAQSSSECRYRVQYAFEEIEIMIANNQTTELQNALNLCHSIDTTSEYDVAMLLERLIELITQYIDQFQLFIESVVWGRNIILNLHSLYSLYLLATNRIEKNQARSFHGVQNFCHDISNTTSTPLESIIRWTRFVYETDNDCFDFRYQSTVDRYSNTQLPRLSWFYLQCTQAGIFRVTDQFNWITKRIDIGYHLVLCRDVLGDQYNSINFFNALTDLKLHFSGHSEQITNIVYTNGFIDPWLYDGITYVTSENATVINVDYYSRSADLTSISGWDSYDLTLAKRKISEIITNWSHPS